MVGLQNSSSLDLQLLLQLSSCPWNPQIFCLLKTFPFPEILIWTPSLVMLREISPFEPIFFSFDRMLSGLIVNFRSTVCALEINNIRVEVNSSNALLFFIVIASSNVIQKWGYLKWSKQVVVVVVVWVLILLSEGEKFNVICLSWLRTC